jgi:hypothetical protein
MNDCYLTAGFPPGRQLPEDTRRLLQEAWVGLDGAGAAGELSALLMLPTSSTSYLVRVKGSAACAPQPLLYATILCLTNFLPSLSLLLQGVAGRATRMP